MLLLFVSLGEVQSRGDENAVRLSRGGRRWCMWLLPSGVVFLGPLTLPWECHLPSIISGPPLKFLRIEEPSYSSDGFGLPVCWNVCIGLSTEGLCGLPLWLLYSCQVRCEFSSDTLSLSEKPSLACSAI